MENQFKDDFFIPPGFPAFPNYPYYSEGEEIIISNTIRIVKDKQSAENALTNKENNESAEKL